MPLGKARARSNALLKLLPAGLSTNPVFAGASWGPALSTIRLRTLERSGARTIEGVEGTATGALICPKRFRLRYSRIHAALCAGSR